MVSPHRRSDATHFYHQFVRTFDETKVVTTGAATSCRRQKTKPLVGRNKAYSYSMESFAGSIRFAGAVRMAGPS